MDSILNFLKNQHLWRLGKKLSDKKVKLDGVKKLKKRKHPVRSEAIKLTTTKKKLWAGIGDFMQLPL